MRNFSRLIAITGCLYCSFCYWQESRRLFDKLRSWDDKVAKYAGWAAQKRWINTRNSAQSEKVAYFALRERHVFTSDVMRSRIHKHINTFCSVAWHNKMLQNLMRADLICWNIRASGGRFAFFRLVKKIKIMRWFTVNMLLKSSL